MFELYIERIVRGGPHRTVRFINVVDSDFHEEIAATRKGIERSVAEAIIKVYEKRGLDPLPALIAAWKYMERIGISSSGKFCHAIQWGSPHFGPYKEHFAKYAMLI